MPSKLAMTAVALGVLAFIVLRVHLGRLEARVTGGALIRVLTVSTDLPAGAEVPRDALTTRELPQAFRESRHIAAADLEDVVGSQLAVGVRANETLHWTDLSGMRPRLRQLSGLIPHGMRAMTLRGAELASDALLRPGDRVDILQSATAGPAELVLQDVVVLAVGDDLGGAASDAKAAQRRAASVTVSATLEQVRVLAGAERLGALRLVLRHPDDIALGSAEHAAEGSAR